MQSQLTPPFTVRRFRQARQLLPAFGHDPRETVNLARFLRTRGRSTLDVRLPWLPFRVIDFLADHLSRSAEVFEYGGGGSTLWFADRVRRVTTVEHDADWHRALAALVPASAAAVMLAPTTDAAGEAAYVSAISASDDESLDAVLVDGRLRVRCVEQAVPKVKPGGVLILDDTDRPAYAPARRYCAGWRESTLTGLVPCKDRPGFTTIWQRPAPVAHPAGSQRTRRTRD